MHLQHVCACVQHLVKFICTCVIHARVLNTKALNSMAYLVFECAGVPARIQMCVCVCGCVCVCVCVCVTPYLRTPPSPSEYSASHIKNIPPGQN